MPRGHIHGRGGLRSTLSRPFHAVASFIGQTLARRGMAFLTSPGDFRHTKVPYFMLGSYPISYLGFQKISKNDLLFVCISMRKSSPRSETAKNRRRSLPFFFLPRVLNTCLGAIFMVGAGFGALWPGRFMPSPHSLANLWQGVSLPF